MRKSQHFPLVALLGLVLIAWHSPVKAQADIIFLVDSSWSIGKDNFQFVREFLYKVVKALKTGGGDFKFALVQYSGSPKTEFQLSTYASVQDVLFHIWSMPYLGGGTRTGLGLEYLIEQHLTAAAGSRASEGVPQVVVVLTDGRSQDDVIPPSSVLQLADVDVFAVGVHHAVEWELKEMASKPLERHMYNVANFSALRDVVGDLVDNVYAAVAPSAPAEVAGVNSDVSAQESTDLLFVIDGSDNIGAANFPLVRDFVLNFIDNLEVGADTIRVAVMQYSNEPQTEFYLNTYGTKTQVLDAVKELRFKGGEEANLGAALDAVLQTHFTEGAGGRADEGVPQTVVVVSAGKSTDDFRLGEMALKQASIYTFGVGAGITESSELEQIATDPSFVFSTPDLSAIDVLQDQLLPYVRGVAQRTVVIHRSSVVGEAVQVSRRDIVFLIDGTANMGNTYFMSIRDFIAKFIEELPIGPDLVQVAVAQFTNDVRVEFDLNTHDSTEAAAEAVRKLKIRGGQVANVGAALEFVRNNMFTSAKGSRKDANVPQLFMILSASRSADDFQDAATELKASGVLTLAAGSKNADSNDLQQIALDKDTVFMFKDFRMLARNPKTIKDLLKTLSGTISTEGPTEVIETTTSVRKVVRDIVFLVDGSSLVNAPNFILAREFIASVIRNLPRDEFFLKDYSTQEEVLAKVGKLRPKGGQPVNTGAALDYALKNHFTRAAGSRKHERVQQALVLITNSKSKDDVKVPADRLAASGVLVYTVGVGRADSQYLESIAFHPSLSFYESSFAGLKDVVGRLDGPLVSVVGEVEVKNQKDIVFLVDGSNNVGDDFPSIRDFILRFIEPLDIGIDQIRFSVIQYSDQPNANFYLNTYSTKEQVVSAVNGMTLLQGDSANLGAALTFLKDTVFTQTYGSRISEKVPQILVVLSTQRSRDSVRSPAIALKTAGVAPLAIGAKNADANEMKLVAIDPSYSFVVSDVPGISAIEQQISSLASALTAEDVETLVSKVEQEDVRRDIVFLFDGTNDARNALPAIREFIRRIANNLEVEEDKVRIAVVQYSDDAKTHFKLNTYKTQKAVVNAVRSMKPKGGTILKTGAALQFVKDNVLSTSAGSRVQEGVPQLLIVLSGGKSADDVAAPSKALKRKGVKTLSIGMKNVDKSELLTLSSSPEFFFNLTEFGELLSIEPQISSLIKTKLGGKDPTPEAESISGTKDVVFLIDGSDDTADGFPAILDFLQRVVESLDVDRDKDHVALVQYSNEPSPHFYLNALSTKDEVLGSIRSLRHKGGRPLNTGAALQFVKDNVFTRSAGSRYGDGVPQVLILLSGERSRDDIRGAVNALKQSGVLMFSVGVNNADLPELQTISHKPTYVFAAYAFKDLRDVHVQLLPAVRQAIEEKYGISHLPPWVKAEVETAKRDIVFLIDGSDDSRMGFLAMAQFMYNLVEDLNVEGAKDHIAVVQYSNEPEVDFYLNAHTAKDDVLRAIQGLRHKGGRPLNTGAALDFVQDKVFTSSAGSRHLHGVAQVLILLLAGRSADDVSSSASSVKYRGVVPLAIGVKNAEIGELQAISFDPSYALFIPNFGDLSTIKEQILSSMAQVTGLTRPESPTVLVEQEVTKRDVVFLLDDSDDSRDEFPQIQQFVESFVENLNVGSSKDRVAVVQYSNEPTSTFDLNSYSTKEEIVGAIRGMLHKGGRERNTGVALHFVKDFVFTPAAGSRNTQGVPQMLLLLTGGRSDDDLGDSAAALKRLGVVPFGIGTRNADNLELQTVSYDPRYVLSVNDFGELPNIQQQLLSFVNRITRQRPPILTTPGVETDAGRRDIVFLLDGSENTRNSFPAIQEFVKTVAEKFDVGTKKAQISVVQYSDDPEAMFYLNSHPTQESVLRAIASLQHKGGRALNTGKALQFVKENVFITSAGSRHLESVPQVLVVIAGGRSTDDIQDPIRALKQSGVVPFGIGTVNTDTLELQSLSYTPSFAFSVAEFVDLPKIGQQLSSLIARVNVQRELETPAAKAEVDSVKRDVVFLLDGSDDASNTFAAVRDFVLSVVQSLDVAENRDRVAVVQYSNTAATDFHLNSYSTKESVLKAVRNLKAKGGTPHYTGAALQYVKDNLFTPSAGSRHLDGVPQILVVLASERSRDAIRGPAAALKRQGVVTFGIGTRDANILEMQTLSTEPSNAFTVSDFGDLPNIQQQLLIKVARQTAPDSSAVPVASEGAKRDIVFLMDGSEENKSAFPALREFVTKMVENLLVAGDEDRVAVVQFSDVAEPAFYLNTYLRKEEILNFVQGLRPRGGSPRNTGAALHFVKDNVFVPSAGSRLREAVPQILILLTSGRSEDDIRASANALKQMGVVPLTVGDSNADTLELQMVAFEPSHAFSLPDFDDLPRIQQQLLTFVRGVVGQGRPEVPTVLVDREGAKRDIVFLLDASDDTADGFPSLREFLVKIVEHLDMDGNRDRVAVIQYSNEPVTSFYLNTFLTKPDVLDALRALRHLGGPLRNAGRALDFVKKNIFVPSAGSRHLDGVPQVLIYVSGGRSRDDVRAAVTALKQQGVVPFSVGTSEADTLELQTVSYDPSFALSVPGFDRLDSVEQQLLSRLKRVDRLRTPEPPVLVEREGAERDVVFLVDGSDETRNGFPAVQEFLIRLVEKLDVQPNKDRVSVVQYSNDADVQFYLSTYFTKEDVLNAIRQLRHKGGKALNMGAALHFVKDNVFIPSAGSRLHAGVPQVLTVLSAGRSTDDIRGPVSSLKKLGVVLFGIGIQKADTLELQIISHDPSFAMSVPEFSDLVGIQQQFLSTMTNIPGEKKNDLQGHLEDGNTDVVFLLDGSDDNKNGFKAMCEFIIKVVENFDVQTKRDQVAVVQYSDEVAVHFFLNTFSTNGEVISAIRSMQPRGGGPLSTGKALQFVKDKVLVSSAGSRRAAGIPQFLILLTSGKSRDDVRREALALKRLGILSFGVGAQNADTLELQTISHDPSFALSVSDVDDLSLVLQPLSFFMRLSMQKRPETPTFAVEFQGFQKDVVFVLDGSDDTRNGFPAMRDFIQGVVETLDVQEDKDRVAVVQYSNDPEANLFFNSHSTKEDVLNAVRGLRHKGGRPLNTGAALQFVRDAILSSAAGSRHGSGVPQILILLSAGTSGDDITGPGSALREMGVVSFAVGIRNADDRELQALSYGPDFAFTTSEFSELPNVQQQIVSSLRGIAEESTEAPLVSLAAPMDVVFLLDGSDDIKNTFPVMRDFVQRIVEMLEVQEDKDRVAVVQYSNEQDASLFLNTYFTKEDVLSAVRAIRHKGGRPLNTGAALQFVRDAILSSAAGGRHGSGVPQILVLLSAGTSGDDVRAPSSALKRSGVVIFAIGTKNTDSEELQMLSHNATFALSLTNFSDLPNVQEQLVRSMKAISRRRASQSPLIPVGVDGTQRDVVFLLDGSSDTRNAFPAMRDFVRRIVETLDVQENQDRVAVVQYSNDQDARLFLNTHFSKEDVLNAIRGLRHKGGRPLNTGAALRFVKDSVFSSSAGSRPADVPKILIVLSGGPSADDVQRPSAALKQKGVLSFSIGARSADDPELQALSYHPDYALRVPDLSDLPSIQQALVSTLRTLSKKRQLRPPTVTVFVLFGLKNDKEKVRKVYNIMGLATKPSVVKLKPFPGDRKLLKWDRRVVGAGWRLNSVGFRRKRRKPKAPEEQEIPEGPRLRLDRHGKDWLKEPSRAVKEGASLETPRAATPNHQVQMSTAAWLGLRVDSALDLCWHEVTEIDQDVIRDVCRNLP
ncbi:CO6A3 protein, partial [Polypterus senegalus]|nr:CO6A3 protein [Polypterus senegalus]